MLTGHGGVAILHETIEGLLALNFRGSRRCLVGTRLLRLREHLRDLGVGRPHFESVVESLDGIVVLLED